MSKKKKNPVTRAILTLRQAGVEFTEHPYDYVDKGGTRRSSQELGVDEHIVIKTLVMEDEEREPLIMLQHGDRSVSTKALARELGKRKIVPCTPTVAERHTGYQVGGTSPFGTKRELPVYVERTILELERIYINGGGRGFLVSLAPSVLVDLLKATPVDAATDRA
ncbi:MAG: aminoacyl-tRNA deacylase [Deltaproteobacteria bacterium]|nr:MAG: aminoacyl-tRNA deacylase [Deltaproteobacteria bacterium]